jgi:hypothetical protein
MARQREAKAFGKGSPGGSRRPGGSAPRPAKIAPGRSSGSQVIPDTVAKRMARRIALATGIPSLLGMAVIVASYVLATRGIVTIQPVVTLLGSGAFFLLGLVGLSYGVISASWEESSGSFWGLEQIPVNIGRIRESIRAMRQSSGSGG